MNADTAADLVRQALSLGLLICAPVLAISLAIGLLTGVLQTVTQVHDQALSFIPRLVLLAVTVLLIFPWSLERLMDYSTSLYHDIPSLF